MASLSNHEQQVSTSSRQLLLALLYLLQQCSRGRTVYFIALDKVTGLSDIF